MRMARKLQNKGVRGDMFRGILTGTLRWGLDLVFWLRICSGGPEYLGVLDTGATISIAVKKLYLLGA